MFFRKLNICFVSQEYPEETGWGGIGAYTYEIAHGLARLGHSVYVVTRAVSKEQEYTEEDGVRVFRILPKFSLNRSRFFWRLNRIWEGYRLSTELILQKLVKTKGIDIIEASSLHGETALFQSLHPRFPVILRIHSCLPKTLIIGKASWRITFRISYWCEWLAVRLSHGITAPTKFIINENNRYLPFKKKQIEVIPNPVNSEVFTPLDYSRTYEDYAKVIFLGRLEYAKGINTLVDAMPLVWKAIPDVHFIFIGRVGLTPEGSSMREWILQNVEKERNQQIEFINHINRKDIVHFYRQATLIVVPSLWESFNYVCIEAMSCGKPIISTYSGGPEETINNDINGFLVPPNDPKTLAEAINRVILDVNLRQRIGEAARKRILDFYDCKVIAERMIMFYRSVLKI